MSFDKPQLAALCARHGRVARVVVARVQGSTPREAGAAMLVWQNGQTGTIGGGALELMATQAAQRALTTGQDYHSQHALGPDMGQCCGGAVHLWTEIYDMARVQALDDQFIARGDGTMPDALRRTLGRWRAGIEIPAPVLCDGWLAEPVQAPRRPLWIWGAGHVGRALVQVLSPLPDFDITWVDISDEKFPNTPPERTTKLIATEPERAVRFAPERAEHLIVTHSHAIDLALCHALLDHGFSFAGLIGSKTKWARFRNRLTALGHSDRAIARVTCPIGTPSHGKHPFAIAIGVGHTLLENDTGSRIRLESIA